MKNKDKKFTDYIYNKIVREILDGKGRKYMSFDNIEKAIQNKLLYSVSRFEYFGTIKINSNLDTQIPTEEIIFRLFNEKVISLKEITKTAA